MQTDGIQAFYLEDICRICMSVKETSTPRHNIFEQSLVDSISILGTSEDSSDQFDDGIRLFDAMQWMFTDGIHPNDGLPTDICQSCEHRVIDSYLLRNRAEQSHIMMLGMRNKTGGTDGDEAETIIGEVDGELYVEERNHISGRINLAGDIEIVPNRKATNVVNKKSGGVVKVIKTDLSEQIVDESPPMTSTCTEFEINFVDDIDDALTTANNSVIPDASDAEEDDEEDGVSFLLSNYEGKASENPATGSATKASGMSPPNKEALRNHQCNVCEKRFMRKSNLIDHLRLHANMRPYECKICNQSFVQTGNLRAHMRIHTKERPYACQVCGKTYNQSGALKVHIRVHTNERNFKCSVCQKAFTNSSDRNKHERVHDISVQFKCELCEGRMFAQRVNYTLHMRKHHGIGPEGKTLPAQELVTIKKQPRKSTPVKGKDN